MSEEKWGFGNGNRSTPWGHAVIGDARTGKRVPLYYGEGMHSYNSNKVYADLGGSELEPFDGHRILIDVRIEMKNYLKESEISGDEVRKGGVCVISSDGVDVYEFFTRDTIWALQKAQQIIGQLNEHSSDWMKADERAKLIGRKVYYSDEPAIISSLIENQGALILKPDGIPAFKTPVWMLDEDRDSDDCREYAKVEVLSPLIWWFRHDKKNGQN